MTCSSYPWSRRFCYNTLRQNHLSTIWNFVCVAWKITLFLHLFSHVQLSLSGAVRMADTQWENRQHLELYSCHTVERRGSFSHPCQCNNHQFSSLVAGCSPPGPAVFDTIYLLYWSISFLIINLTFKKKMSSNNKYVKWQHG